ncbi:MAG: hypothetical protein WAU45_02270 [Blastocatellia bacterium]
MTRAHEELDREIGELRRSINATRTHGILYYVLLVAIIFVGFAIGYATHSLVGAGIIVVGLALVAWREVANFKARTTVLNHLLNEKLAERLQGDDRQREFES